MFNISYTDCCGCESCVTSCPVGCISVEMERGFYYPKINNDKCIDCKLCEEKCPLNNAPSKSNEYFEPIAYAAISKEETIQYSSSSGGVFSSFAENILQKGGVIFGAAFDSNNLVEHICVSDISELHRLRTSKYVQSRMNNCYSSVLQHLKTEKIVLFSGTPCQVAGLKTFLGKAYDNLICIEVICHGVPSPMLWMKYLDTIKAKHRALIRRINFRDKSTGWIKYNFHVQLSNGQQIFNEHHNDPFMDLFLKNYSLRPSCFSCQFKKNKSCADITLGDFWGVETLSSEFNDKKGTSLILIQSKQGAALFKQVESDLKIKKFPVAEALKENTAYYFSVHQPEKYDSFINEIDKLNFNKLYKKYILLNPAHLKSNIKHLIKKII